jgi:hypothetical protein
MEFFFAGFLAFFWGFSFFLRHLGESSVASVNNNDMYIYICILLLLIIPTHTHTLSLSHTHTYTTCVKSVSSVAHINNNEEEEQHLRAGILNIVNSYTEY